MTSSFSNAWTSGNGRMSLVRILVGLLVAPPVGIWLYIFGDRMLNPSHIDTSLFALALFLTYTVTLVLGVPTILLFRHFGFRRWWQFAIGGAVLGPVAMLVIQFNPRASPIPRLEASQLIACASLGLICALLFWAIALFRPHGLRAT